MLPAAPRREERDMSIKRRAQMIEIAAIAAPLALVGMTRFAMTPAAAVASRPKATAMPVVPVSSTAKAPTAEQLKAMDWVRTVESDMPKLASPLDHPKLIVVAPEPVRPAVVPAPAPAPAVTAEPARPASDALAGL